MSPVARRRGFYVASLIGAAGAGFLSHWVPAIVREAPAASAVAQAAPESGIEARLRAVETKTAEIIVTLNNATKILGYLECKANVNNVCPSPERER